MVVKNSIYLCQLIPFYHFWENYVTMINVIHKIKKCNNDQDVCYGCKCDTNSKNPELCFHYKKNVIRRRHNYTSIHCSIAALYLRGTYIFSRHEAVLRAVVFKVLLP